MTGGPGKDHGTNKPPPTGIVQERLKGDTTGLITSQNPSLWHPSWLNKVRTTRKDSEWEWLAKDHPETNPTTIKPEIVSHVEELFSWIPLLYCSPSFPNKVSCFVSRYVSSDNLFPSVRQEPSFGPWKGSPFLQQPHELQHARLPCPSLSPGVCPNSCPLSQWCHLTVTSFAAPFFCLQSFPASGSFPTSWLFASGGQSIGALSSNFSRSPPVNVNFIISPSSEYSGLIPFRTGWVDLITEILECLSITQLQDFSFLVN